MTHRGLLVADRARCRFFELGDVENDAFELVTEFREARDLANPEAVLPGQEVYSNNKSGRNRAPGGGPAHGYDDHRSGHEQETAQRFARRIVSAASEFVKERDLPALVVIAEPRMLGALREEFRRGLPSLALHEISEDMTKQGVDRIRRSLEKHGLVRHAPGSRSANRP